MAAAEITGKLVNRGELARTLGVTPPTIDTWRAKGCPFVGAGARGREWTFDTGAVFSWRCDYVVSEALASYQDGEDGQVSKEEADRRRAVANAITAEIEADNALRNTVLLGEAKATGAAFCQVLKAGLSNAVHKIAGRATTIMNAAEIELMAKDEINRAFAAAQAEWRVRWSRIEAGSSTDDEKGETPHAD